MCDLSSVPSCSGWGVPTDLYSLAGKISRKFKKVLPIFMEHLPCARYPESGNETLKRQMKCLPARSSSFNDFSTTANI